MGTVKAVAWVCIVVIGLFGFGTAAVVLGGPWTTVALVWLGVWIGVAVLAEIDEPTGF